MTKQEINQAIKNLVKDPHEWDSLILAEKLTPILNAIVEAIPEPFNLPNASDTTLGGIRTGSVSDVFTHGAAPYKTMMATEASGISKFCLCAKPLEAVSFTGYTKEQAEGALSPGDHDFIDDLILGKYAGILIAGSAGYYLPLTFTDRSAIVVFGGKDIGGNYGSTFTIYKDVDTYEATYNEI